MDEIAVPPLASKTVSQAKAKKGPFSTKKTVTTTSFFLSTKRLDATNPFGHTNSPTLRKPLHNLASKFTPRPKEKVIPVLSGSGENTEEDEETRVSNLEISNADEERSLPDFWNAT